MRLLRYRVETGSFDISLYIKSSRGFRLSELNMATTMCSLKMLVQSPSAFVQYVTAESAFCGRYCGGFWKLAVVQCLGNLSGEGHIL